MKECNKCKMERLCAELERLKYTRICLGHDPRPKTNYDMLISKTPEELVELFVSGWYDGPIFWCPVTDVECEEVKDCPECFLSWLKATAED